MKIVVTLYIMCKVICQILDKMKIIKRDLFKAYVALGIIKVKPSCCKPKNEPVDENN